MKKPPTIEYCLTPDEKKPVIPKSDGELTAEMRLAYMKGAMHGVLKDMEDYYDWMVNRRDYNKKSFVWRWKARFFKIFMSHFQRRILELEWKLERIVYKSK